MRLYIGNLPPDVTGAQVIELFEQIGEVLDAELLMQEASTRGRGFGFLQMADDQAAARAVFALNGHVLNGHKLNVSLARPDYAPASPDALYVANLPTGVTEQQLHDLFSALGEVVSVQLVADRSAARLCMATDDVSREALRLGNSYTLDGRWLAVSPYTPIRSAHLDTELQARVEQVAAALGETEPGPLGEIRRLVRYCGPTFTQALLGQVQAVEDSGGLMLPGGERRRTPGGVFFHLARSLLSNPMKERVFQFKTKQGRRATQHKAKATTPQPEASDLPIFQWDQRAAVQEQLLQQKGTATTVKITLIGRPGALERRQDLVITTMSYTPKDTLTLPKGVPRPPATETLYTLYIAAKQWSKVEDALRADPDDALIVEGLCAFDAELGGIAVFAQSVTTKRLQQAKNVPSASASSPIKGQATLAPTPKTQVQPPTTAPAQAAGPSGAKGQAAVIAPAVTPSKSTNHTAQPTSGLDATQAARKLTELRQAEQEARERLDGLKALPPEEQTGMAQALQTLQRVKGEIAALRREFPRLT